MIATIVSAPILAVATRSFLPLLILIAIVTALAVRTAIRSRWKKVPLPTRLLHGLHSHLVQIPMLLGQLRYRLDRFWGRTTELIEYKDASSGVPKDQFNSTSDIVRQEKKRLAEHC